MKKKSKKRQDTEKEFIRLVAIMARLRSRDGCPWDREQNHETILRCLVEECYEFYDAVLERDYSKMCEELGDIMLQVVFHSQMASEHNSFDMTDVLKRICDKLERRHPHVFGNTKVKDSSEVLVNWDKIKGKENLHHQRDSILDGVPRALPALLKAMKLQKKAAKVGFDWKNMDPVMEKIQEELGELKRALKKKNDLHIKEETGDLLFSIVNLARHLNLDPEHALNLTNRKFKSRFQEMEKKIKKTGKAMASLSLEELDLYWDREKLKTSNK